jgi:NTE family protein
MATRALILGGGGPVGIAWEAGLIDGLEESGVRLAEADYIVGTSAGAFVGAQLALGRDPAAMYRAQLSAAERYESGERASAPAPNMMGLMGIMQALARGEVSVPELRRQAGRLSLESQTMAEEQFVHMMSAMQPLPEEWPGRAFACTAIDAMTGELASWGNDSGVPLNLAVTSSCAVPGVYPPITINGRRYYDGGIGTATNSTLARGYDRVLVVAVGGANPPVMTDEIRTMRARQLERFAAELQELRDAGSEVDVVRPDEAAVGAFGMNVMDAKRRRPAAEAGLAQGRREAGRVRAFWG